jgi:hypothetical protein
VGLGASTKETLDFGAHEGNCRRECFAASRKLGALRSVQADG